MLGKRALQRLERVDQASVLKYQRFYLKTLFSV